MISAWRFEGWSVAAPVGAATLYGTRRASSTMLWQYAVAAHRIRREAARDATLGPP